jgi:MFS family permease
MTVSTGRSAVRRVAAARGISLTGSQAAFAALAYIVYRLTDESAAWLSVTFLLTMGVQGMVQPIASWFGDRFERRRVRVRDQRRVVPGVCLADRQDTGSFQ